MGTEALRNLEMVNTLTSTQQARNVGGGEAISFASVEDFSAIGLRWAEFRPAVIRSAMKRFAAPLASIHLDAPSVLVERKLVDVVMSGYRLLDPRRREDSIQRMMLGRIHPQLADEILRASQTRSEALLAMSAANDQEEELELLANQSARRTLFLGNPPGGAANLLLTQSAGADGLANILRPHDLLVRRPARKVLSSTRHLVKKHRWKYAASLAALVVISITVPYALDQTRPAVSLNVDEPSLATLAPTMNSGISRPAATPTQIDKAPLLPQSEPITPPVVAMIDPATAQPIEPLESTGGVAAISNAADVANSSAATISGDLKTDASVATTKPESTIQEKTGRDLFESLLADRSITTKLPVSPAASVSIQTIDDDMPKQPMPSVADLQVATDAWRASLASVAPTDWRALSIASRSFGDNASDPARSFVAIRGAVAFDVMSGQWDAADEGVQRITQRFAVTETALAAQVAGEVRPIGDVVTERENVITWLENWIGRSLLAGDLDTADALVRRVQSIAAASKVKSELDVAKSWVQTLSASRRFAAKAIAIESGFNEHLTASDHYAAGRYWALVRRDWVKALPHLSIGSEARLASLATSETLTGGAPDLEELTTLTRGYLAMATKSEGWFADSYVVHAIDVLKRPADMSTVAALDLNRMATSINQDHATTLARAERLKIPPQPAVIASRDTHSAPDLAMVGRLTLNGVDLGVEIAYQPGVRLTPAVIGEIENRLDVSLADAELALTTTLVVERPTAVRILVGSGGKTRTQSLSIDSRELTLIAEPANQRRGVAAYGVDLNAGLWTLQWTTSGFASGASISITDGLSGSPLETRRLTDRNATNGDLPTKLRVQIESNR